MKSLLFLFILSTTSYAEDFRGMRLSSLENSGWVKSGSAYCLVHSHKMHIDLVSESVYGDFVMEFEYRLSKGGNSGVKYVIDEKTGSVGLEMQLLDDDVHPDSKVGPQRRTGALYDIAAPERAPRFAIGEWTSARIKMEDGFVEHWIDDELVLRLDLDSKDFSRRFSKSKYVKFPWLAKRRTGRILLQDHSDPVCFRRVKIRRI